MIRVRSGQRHIELHSCCGCIGIVKRGPPACRIPLAVIEVFEAIGRESFHAASLSIGAAAVESDGITPVEKSLRGIIYDRFNRLTDLQRSKATPGFSQIGARRLAIRIEQSPRAP